MRILFLTSGLSPQADGVGDYCRRLAEALQRQGHDVSLVAINDTFSRDVAGPRLAEKSGLDIVRFPSSQPWNERLSDARAWIEAFAPDWISFHFVCYGFHRRGLVGKLVLQLAHLCNGYRLHVMMHELWVMWGMDCRLRDRLMGVLQRRGVVRFLKALQPSLIDTTIPFYQAVLQREGFSCGILPLCGNFTPVRGDAQNWLTTRIAGAGLPSLWPRTRPLLAAGFFGTIFGHWNPQPLLFKLSEAARSLGKEILLLSGGKCSAAGERLFDQLPEQLDGVQIHKLRLGALTTEQASEYLNTLDLGLTCYSPLFVGKSSTVATMKDHGLPILIGGDDRSLENAWKLEQHVPGVVGLGDSVQRLQVLPSRSPAIDSSTIITATFISKLMATSASLSAPV